MDIFALFATDEKLELEGVDVPLGGKASIKVARFGNTKFANTFQRLQKKYSTELDSADETASEAAATKLMIETVAETILVGWDNLEWQGKPIKYSVENAKKLLALKDFRARVIDISKDVSQYRAQKAAEAEKN